MQTDNSGDQINQKVDIQQIGIDFVNYYFSNLTNNLDVLLSSHLLKPHTRIKYKNLEYKGNELVKLLGELNSLILFQIEEIITLDSGGRRADILVIGKCQTKDLTKKLFKFSQYFTIANNKENWFLHNSLLSILN